MKGTFKIHLRFDKTLKSGMVPMEIVYSVSNQRKYLNTGQKIYPKYWNQFAQKCIYLPVKDAKKVYPSQQLHSQMQIDAITNSLDCIYNRIRNIEQDFVRSKTPFSSHMVINAYKGQETTPIKKEEPRNYLFDFITNYIEENQALRVKGSLSVYKSLSKHLGVYQNYLGEHKCLFELLKLQFFVGAVMGWFYFLIFRLAYSSIFDFGVEYHSGILKKMFSVSMRRFANQKILIVFGLNPAANILWFIIHLNYFNKKLRLRIQPQLLFFKEAQCAKEYKPILLENTLLQ